MTTLVACGGLDIEHKLRVGTDCPDPEVIGTVTYPLGPGIELVCTRIRIVSGPPYRGATYLECQEPEHRKGRY